MDLKGSLVHCFTPTDNSGILPITYFHALARLGAEGLVLIEPAQPFVSLGLFDDTGTCLDLDFCQSHGLPVMRRETGGGMVLLGPGQVFYTLVIKRGHGRVPSKVDDAYRYLSAAPIAVYRQFGVPTRLRPVNDIVTQAGRKIAGQGAGDINGHFCFVGSILIDFDTELMHRIAKVPDPALRPPLKEALDAGMTSLYRETGVRPSGAAIKAALAAAFAPLVGELSPRATPACLTAAARQVAEELAHVETVMQEDTRPRALFKIREGLYARQRDIPYRGQRLAVSLLIHEGHVERVHVAGDGPLVDLSALIGVRFDRSALQAALATRPDPALSVDQVIAALMDGVD